MAVAKSKTKVVKMKLWQKDYKLNEQIKNFTVGDDYIRDQKLVR